MENVVIQGVEMNPIAAGALLTICGIAIVFLVLVILIFAIFVFGKIMVAGSKKDTSAKVEKPKAAPAPKKVVPVAPAVSSQDDGELIAVIAAAVDAMYAGTGKKAVIRNIRPAVSGGRSAWANAGLVQNVRSF